MKKSLRQIIGWAMILSLALLSFPVMPEVRAAESLNSVSDVITNSTPLATGVTHNFYFTTNATLTQNYVIDVTFATGFTGLNIGNFTCPANTTASHPGTAQIVRCIVDGGQTLGPGAYQVTVTTVTNPAKVNPEGIADTYQMLIETRDSAGGTLLETANAMVAIIETVTVTATVDASLSFSISGVASGQSAKNVTTNASSSTTTIPFGVLPIGSSVVAAQDLRVNTNAREGYSVIVFQDQDLTSSAADRIHCFAEGTCTPYGTTTAWAVPSGTIDEVETYGHFGLSSQDAGVTKAGGCQDPDDEGLNGTRAYGTTTANLWAGLDGTNHVPVMCHTGPVTGEVVHKSLTRVVYQVEITALQSAGEYTNTLTYIATPTY